MKKIKAEQWIEKLQLEPHPEGGYFRQTYRAEVQVRRELENPHSENATHTILEWGASESDARESGEARAASTAIYFLLEGKNFSAFHRLRSDEMWHFYAGSPLLVHVIEASGKYSTIMLGSDAEAGQVFQAVVPAGCWFASHVADWKSWALVGCTVAPGFEFEDFELAKREELTKEFPQHGQVIRSLTREVPN